jgi:hypothetical protein
LNANNFSLIESECPQSRSRLLLGIFGGFLNSFLLSLRDRFIRSNKTNAINSRCASFDGFI